LWKTAQGWDCKGNIQMYFLILIFSLILVLQTHKWHWRQRNCNWPNHLPNHISVLWFCN
jgi:hypothetical protein